MRGSTRIVLLVLGLFLLIAGCEKTVEEGAIKPLEAAFDGRQKASLESAKSAVASVRLALLARQAQSPASEFPNSIEIRDFTSLRQALPEANLPEDIASVGWDSDAGVSYSSDGATFTFTVRAVRGGESITATPGGVTVEQSPP